MNRKYIRKPVWVLSDIKESEQEKRTERRQTQRTQVFDSVAELVAGTIHQVFLKLVTSMRTHLILFGQLVQTVSIQFHPIITVNTKQKK